MNCCTHCFEDEFIRSQIMMVGKKGDCDYCGSQGAKVVTISVIAPLLCTVIELYEPLVVGHNVMELPAWGNSLAELIANDWNLFSDALSEIEQNRFLNDVLPDLGDGMKDNAEDYWISYDDAVFSVSESDIWSDFCKLIKHERRFILRPGESGLDHIEEWPDLVLEPGVELWRARIGTAEGSYGCKPYPPSEMGAPPNKVARAGRANPSGIAFLYLATDQPTALSEVRPWKGASVSIAKFRLTHSTKLVDLSKEIYISSPFQFMDNPDTNLRIEINNRKLLRYLGKELAKPVDPSKADVDYLPTQYLVELIRERGFDGLKFKSAMGTGANIVLFNKECAEAISSDLVEVTDINYSFSSSYVVR